MGNLKTELKEKLDEISLVYIFAQEVYLYTEYFHNPETEDEFRLLSDSIHSTHLYFIAHSMFRTLINEMSKLFSRSNSDKYRLVAFVDSLSDNGHFRKIGFPCEKIVFWKEKLYENKNVIDQILLLRNKAYAHTDHVSNFSCGIDITFEELKSLLDLALEIIKNVYNIVFDTYFDEESAQFDRKKFLIMKLLAKSESQRREELTNEYKKLMKK